MKNTVLFKGNNVQLSGMFLEKGIAPDFEFVKVDLSLGRLYDLSAKIKVIITAPSLDTSVCALDAKKFNQTLNEYPVSLVYMTRDLPFAMKRFCAAEGLENIIPGSDFRHLGFAGSYGVAMQQGPLAGLLARAIWVLDANHTILYSELVPEVTNEINYEAVLQVIRAHI